jgi:hypothetical protein
MKESENANKAKQHQIKIHVTEKEGTQSQVGTSAKWRGVMAVRFGARSGRTG